MNLQGYQENFRLRIYVIHAPGGLMLLRDAWYQARCHVIMNLQNPF